jgi:hypothetical protein
MELVSEGGSLVCPPCSLGGTITIDVTIGSVTAADVTAPGTNTGPFNQNITVGPDQITPSITRITIHDATLQNNILMLSLPVTSLMNYAGGPICGPSISLCQVSGGTIGSGIEGSFEVVSGSLSPVPGPIAGAGLPGLILAGGGLLGWWRRRQKMIYE